MTRHDALCSAAELRCEAAMWDRMGEHTLAQARRATARKILNSCVGRPLAAPEVTVAALP